MGALFLLVAAFCGLAVVGCVVAEVIERAEARRRPVTLIRSIPRRTVR